MFCEMCRDAALHGDGPPRFGGIYEMHANSTADPAFWGERWELYKVHRHTRPNSYFTGYQSVHGATCSRSKSFMQIHLIAHFEPLFHLELTITVQLMSANLALACYIFEYCPVRSR